MEGLRGAVFSYWILLLVAKTSLVSAGRVNIHQRLGVAGFFWDVSGSGRAGGPGSTNVLHLCQRDCIAESSATRQAQRIPLLLFHLKRHGTRHRPDVWIVIFIDTRLEGSCPNRVLRAQPEFQLHGLSGRERVEI